MIILLIIVSLAYVFLTGTLIFGWRKIPEYVLSGKPPEIRFSIVVPYRNEAENLPDLLNSLSLLKYPASHFEILLVNDASEDASREICSQYKDANPDLNIHLLENERITSSPKKDAILTALKNAQFEYLLTTDADCIVPETWLQAYNEKIAETSAQLVAGPVAFFPVREKTGRKYFRHFQEMDFLSLQAAGAGGFGLDQPFMCNGANLCYSKQAFYEVGGFEGNDHISSGDDVFLLQKFAAAGLQLEFLKAKEAIILTKPQPDFYALISQRIRWAAKTSAYKSSFAKLLGITVLLMNLLLIIGAFLALFSIIPYQPLLIVFLFKFNLDFLLIYQSAKFFDRQEVLRNYFWSSIVYPFFSTYVAVLSLFRGFEWKGRKFNK
ncbi:glycosyltransferase [Antarcticibacterium flavum]|uniref:Glycosyltransferase n=1 Tax=Antarcticibacterium flavum TaxID=2058175 RepID=A0A5B7X5M7_9FLAO|nr:MULTISPECIES: glycosyltransferase [Antarcticibacterium]MCM4161902.1 transmembrane family-2 glycosyl transferase [Antarcticibacterium sp. W02-3]QCY70021.1 glycosyltransferase [Antarcticibacterium flavum]